MKNILLLFFSLLLFSCGSPSETDNATDTDTPVETPAAKKYTISDFSESPEFPDAKIASVGFKNGKFNFNIESETYKLGEQTNDAPQKMCANSGKGQHIHLLVDNKPYAAKYEPTFDYDIEDGMHYILAFLSRSYHESIKTDDAHVAYSVQIKDNSFQNAGAVDGPMLFYSRPKGTYVGKADTEKVMLDFYLVNADLAGDGYKVQVDINGEQTDVVDDWKPYFIEGLPMGENTIKLTLLNADGTVADVPLNPVERTFTLKADPIENQ